MPAPDCLELFERASELALPVRIVRGTLDPVISATELDRLAASIPDARRLEWPGVGHCTQMEAAPETARLVLEALSPPLGGGQR